MYLYANGGDITPNVAHPRPIRAAPVGEGEEETDRPAVFFVPSSTGVRSGGSERYGARKRNFNSPPPRSLIGYNDFNRFGKNRYYLYVRHVFVSSHVHARTGV